MIYLKKKQRKQAVGLCFYLSFFVRNGRTYQKMVWVSPLGDSELKDEESQRAHNYGEQMTSKLIVLKNGAPQQTSKNK